MLILYYYVRIFIVFISFRYYSRALIILHTYMFNMVIQNRAELNSVSDTLLLKCRLFCC